MVDLKSSREIIDTLDIAIASLYKTRMMAVKNIANYKKTNNIAVLDEGREQQVLDNVLSILKDDEKEYAEDIIALYKFIMDYSKNKQSTNATHLFTHLLYMPKFIFVFTFELLFELLITIGWL